MSGEAYDLSILIKTTLDKLALEQAKQGLDDLKSSASGGAGAIDASTAALGKMAGGASTAELDKIVKSLRNVHQAGALVENMAAGNIAPALGNLARMGGGAFASLGPLLTVLGPVGAAIMGWQFGQKIDEATGFSEAIKGMVVPLEQVHGGVRLTTQALEAMAQVNLDKLKTDLDEIDKNLSNRERVIQQEKADKSARVQAETARDVALLESKMPEGPERDKAVARRQAIGDQQLNDIGVGASKSTQDALSGSFDLVGQSLRKAVETAEAKLSAMEEKYKNTSDPLQQKLYPAVRNNLQAQVDQARAEKEKYESSPEYLNRKAEYELRMQHEASSQQTAGIAAEASGLKTGNTLSAIAQASQKAEQEKRAAAEVVRLEAEKTKLEAESKALLARQKSIADSPEAARAARERADVEGVDARIADFEATGGGKHMSKKSFSYRQGLSKLRGERQKEASEMDVADEALSDLGASIVGALSAHARQLQALAAQIKNIEGQNRSDS